MRKVSHLHEMPEESGPTSAHTYMGYGVTRTDTYSVNIDPVRGTFYILHCFEEVVFSPIPRTTPPCQPKTMKELFLVVLLLLKYCEAFLSLSSQKRIGSWPRSKTGRYF